MLSAVVAHAGRPPQPHDLWTAWNFDPLLIAAMTVAVWAYVGGRRPGRRTRFDALRARCFAGALAAVGIALISPLDALSSALAAAHMVQHLLLMLVAAPLFALSAPWSSLLRGAPLVLRQAGGRWRRQIGLAAGSRRMLRHPAAVWLLHAGTLWGWHSALAYDAALENHALHVTQHLAFLLTGVLFWRVLVGARRGFRVSPGLGVLLIFGMALQSVFLSLLLTFAPRPWYTAYATTTTPWGLQPLADQQLAGAIMWVPAGLVYLAAALALLHSWLAGVEHDGLVTVP